MNMKLKFECKRFQFFRPTSRPKCILDKLGIGINLVHNTKWYYMEMFQVQKHKYQKVHKGIKTIKVEYTEKE
jgi:hypothetical protein